MCNRIDIKCGLEPNSFGHALGLRKVKDDAPVQESPWTCK